MSYIEPATLTQDTEGSIQITEAKDGKNASATVHTLNCNATLDSRTSYAQIYWVYQQKDGEDERITADTTNAAVKVTIWRYIKLLDVDNQRSSESIDCK